MRAIQKISQIKRYKFQQFKKNQNLKKILIIYCSFRREKMKLTSVKVLKSLLKAPGN
jgi:hypothetical protein